MRWPRWWTGSISTAPSGATGLTVSKHFWKGWTHEHHEPAIKDQSSSHESNGYEQSNSHERSTKHEQSNRDSQYPCGREGLPAPAREAVARPHRKPAPRAMD